MTHNSSHLGNGNTYLQFGSANITFKAARKVQTHRFAAVHAALPAPSMRETGCNPLCRSNTRLELTGTYFYREGSGSSGTTINCLSDSWWQHLITESRYAVEEDLISKKIKLDGNSSSQSSYWNREANSTLTPTMGVAACTTPLSDSALLCGMHRSLHICRYIYIRHCWNFECACVSLKSSEDFFLSIWTPAQKIKTIFLINYSQSKFC